MGFIPVLAVCCLLLAGPVRSQPVIVGRLEISTSGYVGGITFYDGYLYETGDRDTQVKIRVRNTGEVIDSWTPPNVGGCLADIAYDSKRNLMWYKILGPAPLYAVAPGGSSIEKEFSPGQYVFGICYDAVDDLLWLTDSERGRIIKVDPDSLQTVATINTSFSPRGIVRVGDRLWITEPGEYPPEVGDGYLHECYLDGSKTGVTMEIPEEGYDHDIGGVTIDDQGYLWIRGGKHSYIYKVDIQQQAKTPPPAFPTPTPKPTATSGPTPVIYVLDSGDYNGDGTTDIAVFRPIQGFWSARGVTWVRFGGTNDMPVSGDYDGDATTDFAVFRPAVGRWAIRRVTRVYFGSSGAVPVPGDFDGDGSCDVAVFGARGALWAVRGFTRVYFGTEGDLPVPSFYNRDSAKDMAIFRPSTGFWSAIGAGSTYFGMNGDYPLPGDYDGDGADDAAVFRRSASLWFVRDITRANFGSPSDVPIAGDFDGDGTLDFGVFRPAWGWWAIRGITSCYFGGPSDIPVPAPLP